MADSTTTVPVRTATTVYSTTVKSDKSTYSTGTTTIDRTAGTQKLGTLSSTPTTTTTTTTSTPLTIGATIFTAPTTTTATTTGTKSTTSTGINTI